MNGARANLSKCLIPKTSRALFPLKGGISLWLYSPLVGVNTLYKYPLHTLPNDSQSLTAYCLPPDYTATTLTPLLATLQPNP